MSANKIKECIAQISEEGYNFYTVTENGRKIVIGGMPERFADTYVKEARYADAVVMLTSKPEFSGSLAALLDVNPNVAVYGSAACLRNLKEIVNRSFNERLVKDAVETDGIRFLILPNLHWMDTIMAVSDGVLFSGEAFSGFDGSAVGLKTYFDRVLAVNKSFVRDAVDRLGELNITAVCPAYGMTCPQGSVCVSAEPRELLDKYRMGSAENAPDKVRAAVLYASGSGFTKTLAERAAAALGDYDVTLLDVYHATVVEIRQAINRADMLLIGTHTINRNAPQEIWDAVTHLDLINKRGMPYMVFGSYGWGGDAVQLIDKTLQNMGMRRGAKAVDVLFKPDAADLERIDKAVAQLIQYEREYRKN